MLGKAIFAVDDDFRSHLQNDAMPLMIRLQRAVSYFGTYDSIAGLKHHLDKDELHTQVLELLWQDREADYHSYQHFTAWDVNDDDFKNLVLHLMDLDPKRRFTAQQALAHPWFQRIE